MFGDTSVKIDRTLSTLIFYNKVLTGQLETHNQHLSAMKKLLLILVAGILFSPQIDADTILMRDGTEMNVSVQQLSDTKVMYRLNKKDDVKTLPTRDVYMIKFDKRGNVYITPEGKRVTGENRPIPRDADIVYLVDGGEFPAYNLNVEENVVSFLLKKPSKKVIPVAEVYPRCQVFKIKYTDGTTDVITSIDNVARAEEKTAEVQIHEAKEELEPEYQVVFHHVGKNETLNSIAARYDVAVEDIKSWNEMPAKMKADSPVKAGTQIMIYVKPATDN